jgi:antitoxin ParD1/3/4
MRTLNISLPASLKDFIEEQVVKRGYGTSSEYIRELVRRDQQRQQLRALMGRGTGTASDDTHSSDLLRARPPHRRARDDE